MCARTCVCTGKLGGAVDVSTWNHSPSDTRDSSEPGGEGAARPGRGAACPLSVPGGVGGLPGRGGSRMSTAAGSLGGEVGVVTPPKQSSQMWGQCAGRGCWLCPAVSGPLTWAAGGGPLPVETRAERGAHMGGGAQWHPRAWSEQLGPLNASP